MSYRYRTPALALICVSLLSTACQDGSGPIVGSVNDEVTAPAVAAPAAATLPFRQISAGDTHTCGVTTDDLAYCWGLGRPAPTPVLGGLRFRDVSAGVDRTCGVTTGQRAFCWENDLVPVEVPGGRRFRQISAGLEYTCGVTTADVAFCWGSNEFGRLGTGGGFTEIPARVAGGLRFRRVFAAASHTCGVTLDNRAFCWGNNVFGQLGDGTIQTRPRPVAVTGGLLFQEVRPGSGFPAGFDPPEFDTGFSCGVTLDDRAYCWGSGALGSTTGSSTTPILVAGGRRFNAIHPGLFHACARTTSNLAFCWGSDEFGQLGNVGGASQTPVRVAGGLRLSGLTAAPTGWHSCAVTVDNQAYCWGRNHRGQLGDGTTTDRSTPVPVSGPTP
jgi:alpha-tubulin suppressor-like RCC1 family protein